jgi:hypothetical protein
MKLLVNYSFLLILLYILFYFIIRKNPLEYFYPSLFGFDPHIIPQPRYSNCTPENNCFPGAYARTQIYQNVCQPAYGLNRQKIPIYDNCQRTLGDFMATPKSYYTCWVDKHLNRRCGWTPRM